MDKMNLRWLGCTIILLVAVTTHGSLAEEEWSWGTEKKESSTVLPDVTTPLATHAATSAINDTESKQEDIQPRFLGLGQKLCALGLGSKCDKKTYPPAINSHYGPPAAASNPISSSYATISYDKVEEHGYPSAPSKGSAVNLKPFFAVPKPFATQAALKPSHIFPDTQHGLPAPKPAYVAPNPVLSLHAPVKPTSVVQHIHSHTHIHQGTPTVATSGSVGLIPPTPTSPIGSVSSAVFVQSSGGLGQTTSGTGFQPVAQSVSGGSFVPVPPVTLPGSSQSTSGTGFTGFQSAGQPVSTGSFLPTITLTGSSQTSSGSGFNVLQPVPQQVPIGSFVPPKTLPGSIIEEEFSAYREECQCVPRSFCPLNDIIARRLPTDISGLIDARSRVSDILSNATDAETEEVVTDVATEVDNSTQIEAQQDSVPALTKPQDESRQKRDLLTSTAHGHVHGHDDHQVSQTQERQFGGYVPGLKGCQADHVCCRNPIYGPPKQQYTCGKSNAAGVLGRVKNPHYINGDAEFAEYPWQAAILKLEQGESMYVCGAALISDKHLLTAAHCVSSLQPNSLKVRLGEWDVATTTEFYQHVEIHVASVNIHPEYYAGNLQNDIALITLQHIVDFAKNPHISPVCLPENYNSFVGQRCHSTGWGKDAFGEGGKFQRILKEVEVPVVSHLQCQTALRHTHLGATFNLHEGNICAGGEEGRDTCKGDGGGPLVCQGSNGSAQLAGLVSWGIGCGKVGIPGVYVNVAHYLDWIRVYLH